MIWKIGSVSSSGEIQKKYVCVIQLMSGIQNRDYPIMNAPCAKRTLIDIVLVYQRSDNRKRHALLHVGVLFWNVFNVKKNWRNFDFSKHHDEKLLAD